MSSLYIHGHLLQVSPQCHWSITYFPSLFALPQSWTTILCDLLSSNFNYFLPHICRYACIHITTCTILLYVGTICTYYYMYLLHIYSIFIDPIKIDELTRLTTNSLCTLSHSFSLIRGYHFSCLPLIS